MRADGLRIVMPDETLEVPVRAYDLCEVCTFSERFDVVLVLMKAYDTRWACRLIEPYVKPDGLVVGVQNGMTADIVADEVGPQRAMGCVIEITSEMFEPGIVQRHSPPSRSWFAVGSTDAATHGREDEIAAAAPALRRRRDRRRHPGHQVDEAREQLHHAGADGDRSACRWSRPPPCPAMRELMLRAGQEALETGAALGHPVLPIFGLTPDDVRQSEPRGRDAARHAVRRASCCPHSTTTVLHDWMKGRHSEVDDVNGLVVAEQARLGGAAPVNAAVVELAHRIERGELLPGAANVAALRDLAGLPPLATAA